MHSRGSSYELIVLGAAGRWLPAEDEHVADVAVYLTVMGACAAARVGGWRRDWPRFLAGRDPIVATWWSTEAGWIMTNPQPSAPSPVPWRPCWRYRDVASVGRPRAARWSAKDLTKLARIALPLTAVPADGWPITPLSV